MTVVVQQRETELFATADLGWTKAPGEALAFRTTLEALDYCRAKNLSNVSIVLRFDNPHLDVRLPYRWQVQSDAPATGGNLDQTA